MTNRDKRIRLIERAMNKLAPLEACCTLCPRDCRVDRTQREKGVCQTGNQASVSHALLHFGEEPVLSGTHRFESVGHRGGRAGSGAVFFSGCNLKCLFCQNYQLSWLHEGEPVTDMELAEMMLRLQGQGALNINFVSPSHVVLPILRALKIAYGQGLEIPLVWNSNGYDGLEVIQSLDGIIDIYLPDLKYRSPALSKKYSGAADYFEHASAALREMSVQQPVLEMGPDGAARHGLIVRHLVLPGMVDDSLAVLDWLRATISPYIGLSLMSQFRPCYKAPAELRRSLPSTEYRLASDRAAGFVHAHLFLQPEPFARDEHLVPDFRKREPFVWNK